MNRPLARLRYALRRHGPIGCLRLAAINLGLLVRGLARPAVEIARDDFDRQYDIDTSATREIGTLDVLESASARYAVRYQPSEAQLVRNSIEGLKIDPRGFVFVDFGSGKGRVLIVAASFPFAAVTGIEFSRELHRTALHNIARLPAAAIRAGRIDSIHADAAGYVLPAADLVCYLYNPFGPPVLSPVVERLVAHSNCGHRVLVIYIDPQHRDLFEQTGRFAILSETPGRLVMAAVGYDGTAHGRNTAVGASS